MGTMHQRLTDCPACGRSIEAEFAYDLHLEDAVVDASRPVGNETTFQQGAEVRATVKITGMRVSHDCIPKVMRGPAESASTL